MASNKILKRDMTAEFVRSILAYNAETGIFSWRIKSSAQVNVGDIAGFKKSDGYIEIKINRKTLRAHRLAWLYVYGDWPTQLIDHIDGNRSNNAIKNLRQVDCTHNTFHATKKMVRGYALHKATGYYRAYVSKNGRQHYLGLFKTEQEARAAYETAAQELYGDFFKARQFLPMGNMA